MIINTLTTNVNNYFDQNPIEVIGDINVLI